MAPRTVAADIKLKAFSCPRCGALADQEWFEVYARATREGQAPHVHDAEFLAVLKSDLKSAGTSEEIREAIESWIPEVEKNMLGDIGLKYHKDSKYCSYELINVYSSRCYSCKETTLWRHKSILYPAERFGVGPNDDLPDDIKSDFEEARTIVDYSPRGAAALLRLCVQKLCKHLGEPGKNINDDIASLVTKGLDPRVAQALDIVRVVGNEAVHPGTMDLRDDRGMATKLFELVNRIATDTITHPKEVKALFAGLPPDKIAAIAKRDSGAPP